jgi:hypothetical protein
MTVVLIAQRVKKSNRAKRTTAPHDEEHKSIEMQAHAPPLQATVASGAIVGPVVDNRECTNLFFFFYLIN